MFGGAVALLLAAGMSSCGKSCYECRYEAAHMYYCPDDYPNHQALKADMQNAKNAGYKCKKQWSD